MLNYRPSKRIGITVLNESSAELLKLLVVEGKKMSFVGLPDPVRRARDGAVSAPDDDVAMEQFRRDAQDELDAYIKNPSLPIDVLDTKLNTDDRESVLQAKLRMIAREATTAREELGINTLFLTLGTVEWSETDERSYRAPLVFIPVVLEKQGNGSMRLIHDGSDVGSNLPLRAKFAEFNLKLPDLEDDKPISEYFSEIESTIRDRASWIVHRDEICLGFFNYEKYAMYVDLGGDAWPAERKPWLHADLVSMLGGGYGTPDSPIGDSTQLDSVRPVDKAREVYDADSSQLIAMIRASAGLSIVVEGPPGTGKSQTITNIIAEAVAAGKRVLFVSAKRAALDVVKRNLERADLGAMCLDLHDKLTNRKAFYSELKRTVGTSLALKPEDQRIARLTEIRDRLNAHSEAVNAELPAYGTSPFQAMSILAALPKEEPEDRAGRIPFESLCNWKSTDLQAGLPIVEALQTRLRAAGVPVEHPFYGAGIDYVDPGMKLDLREGLASATDRLEAALTAMATAAEALKVQVPLTPANLAVLRVCVEMALAAPALDGVACRVATWKEQERMVREVIASLQVLAEIRAARVNEVRPEVWQADLRAIAEAYDRYSGAWYKPLVGAYRGARRELAEYLGPGAPSEPGELRRLVRDVRRAQAEEALIDSRHDAMRRLMGVQWEGRETDAGVLERVLAWILDLDAKVSQGQIPAGLLSFFEGAHDDEQVKALTEAASERVRQAMDAYVTVAGLLKIDPSRATDTELGQLLDRVRAWNESLDRLPEYISLNESRRHVAELGLECLLEVADRWPLASERLRDSLVRSYYQGVVREAMTSRPELKAFEREGHEALIRDFQSLDDFKLKYNRAQVRLAHQRQLPTFDKAMGNLLQLRLQCELQRSHKPIRWIMSRAGEAIQRIKPVFMMSPLSVAIHLPPDLPPFDMVIFDEASQIRPEDAICSIVRAKQSIVVGDTRQMPPTSFFDRLVGDDEPEEITGEGELGAEAHKLESVLSLMSAVAMGHARRPDLRWHYRSVHPSLIQPSNEMFYENRLIVFPSPGSQIDAERVGVVFHHHPETVYEPGDRKRVNRLEAAIVADKVLEQVKTEPEMSLLVATMNKPQADLIYAEVQKRERLEPGPFQEHAKLHPHEPLEVKNLENVQGDERDLILISITYGRDEAGVLRQNFGPLLAEGGERRLNVLITRARKRCEVFSNITADDIRLDGPRAGVQALKRYLHLAKDGITDVPLTTGLSEESPFEEEVSAALRDAGLDVDTQVGTEGYRIDLGVVDPEHPGSYILGIECDGATYHSARSARDRDKLRQRVLEIRGWKLHRIWSSDWWQDREGETRRLLAAIEAATLARHQPEPPPAIAQPEPGPVIVERAGARRSAPPRPYVVASPIICGSESELGAYMLAVVEAEGPICRELLLSRLLTASGRARSSANTRRWLEAVIGSNLSGVRVSSEALYFDASQLGAPRDWSARPANERKAEFVTEPEMAAALREVVGESFGVSEEEACKGAYLLLGFRRTTASGMARAKHVVDRMLASKVFVQGDGGLRLGAASGLR